MGGAPLGSFGGNVRVRNIQLGEDGRVTCDPELKLHVDPKPGQEGEAAQQNAVAVDDAASAAAAMSITEKAEVRRCKLDTLHPGFERNVQVQCSSTLSFLVHRVPLNPCIPLHRGGGRPAEEAGGAAPRRDG